MNFRALLPAMALALPLTLAGCAGGGAGGAGGNLVIGSCSLGCTTGGTGQVSCGVTDVFVNQELRIAFSTTIDLTSVNNNTFQVTEISSGKTPPGSFSLSPSDTKVLVYRPLLTFDSSGNPLFGLNDGETYQIKLPGTNLDSIGPYVRSSSGQSNQNRMLCTVVASQGIFDPKPGAPTMQIFVDVADITSYDPMFFPTNIFEDVEATGTVLTDVFRDTNMTIIFDDLMNPGTLVNPVTGESDFLRIIIDPDGDVTDATDQVDLEGSFTINVDQDALITTVVFLPTESLPSAGSDPLNPRKMIVRVPPQVVDLGGIAVSNSGDTLFVPEAVPFPEIPMVEDFVDSGNEDADRTGNTWASGSGLVKGPGGGSGRLGELIIPAGTTVTLNTDNETFASITDPSVYDPTNTVDQLVPGTVDPVVGGIFEFSHVRVDVGGTLKFTGSNPARLYVRGEAKIQGILDVSGTDAITHVDLLFDGGNGANGGPNGGEGGDGGDLPDVGSTGDLLFAGGIDNPNDPFYYFDLNGKPGTGIPFPDTLAPTSFEGEGDGGIAWPQPTGIDPTLGMPDNRADIDGQQYDPGALCKETTPGGPGAGGGYGLSGTSPVVTEAFGSQVDMLPPNAAPGDSSELAIDALVMSLDPELGLLRGGSGGGGGGGHILDTATNGTVIFGPCDKQTSGAAASIVSYKQHSSAAGGGGGGGVQIQAGRQVTLDGILDAGGGLGGSRVSSGAGKNAQSGGGGSGGGVLLQGPSVQVSAVPGRVDISGGMGGTGNPAGSFGGNGGAGLLRIETFQPLPSLATEATKVAPDPVALAALGATAGDIMSIAEWFPTTAMDSEPESMSGAQSCWLQPDGNFFLLTFINDFGATGTLGWDMTLQIAGVPTPQSFRGPNEITAGTLQGLLGNQLGASSVIVRFQGARTLSPIDNLCEVELYGVESQIFPGSLTPWRPHPFALNDWYGDPTLRPNMIRFSIMWDADEIFYNNIQSVLDLSILVQPD